MDEQDLLNEAESAVERAPEYSTWGQVSLNVWECVWPKGSMPMPYTPGVHNPKDRRVRIELTVIPIDEMQAKYNAELKTTQETHDWAGVTLPSIKALGVTVASLRNAFVKITKRPNGKTYPKKDTNGQPTGETGKLTDFIFDKVFASMDECVADYNATFGAPADDFAPIAGDVPGTVSPAQAAPVQAAGPSMDTLISFARNFVKNAIKNHPGDLAAITAEVTQQMEVKNSAFFAGKLAANSPEVTAMIMMEMGA